MLFYNDRGTQLQLTDGLELHLGVACSEALNGRPRRTARGTQRPRTAKRRN